jgi:hypothetical protein
VDELVAFVRACLGEDARAAEHAQWGMQGQWFTEANDKVDEFVQRMSPARVLAEVAAKRAIVDSYQWHIDNADRPFAYERAGEMQLAERHVQLLAQPYAGRPGWREEWATGGAA